MKKIIIGVLIAVLTGCGGMELGGKLGVYRIDDRSEAITVKTADKPLKCLFIECPGLENIKGS